MRECMWCLQIFILQTDEKVLPFRGYFFSNQTLTPIFPYLYTFNSIIGSYCAIIVTAGTTFNFIATTHATAKFAIVNYKLGQLRSENSNCDNLMKECIVCHQNAILYASLDCCSMCQLRNIFTILHSCLFFSQFNAVAPNLIASSFSYILSYM